jgi:23S rRNA (uracil1939-C5)-methyltransferase
MSIGSQPATSSPDAIGTIKPTASEEGDLFDSQHSRAPVTVRFGPTATSSKRVRPAQVALACPHFPPCAGCPGIPIAYEEQLATKRRELLDTLRPLLRSEEAVAATVPSPRLRGYRNQARLVFRRMSRGGTNHVGLGLYLPGSHRVVHIPHCPIQPSILNDVAQTVTQVAERLQLSVYDERQGTGALRYLALRTDRRRKHLLLTVVVGEDVGQPLRLLAEAVRHRHPEVVGVSLHVNKRHSNVIFAGEDGWTVGSARLEDEVGGRRIFVSPRSFLQVNHEQAEWIYSRLASRLGGGPDGGSDTASTALDTPAGATQVGAESAAPREIVLDLYCGIGGIALHLALPGRLVLGVEESTEAVEDARRAAHANGLTNVRFIAARVEDFLQAPGKYAAEMDTLPLRAAVLNPPRAGCRPAVMEGLAALRPEHLAYVSCRPMSMARDLALLGAAYAIEEATPVDMIPLTPHIEALCFLRRV